MNEREIAVKIVQKLKDRGYSAYIVGGAVRDSLLGLNPKDWDVASDAPLEVVESIFEHTDAVGKHFGVIIVHLGGFSVEVARYRKDIGGENGRHPDSVEFCSIEEDSKRRDFTINAMYMDENGSILDFHNGQEDLKSGIIRCIENPNERFKEDYLRVLRAIRFAGRYDFAIHNDTFEAIITHGAGIKGISKERVYNELKQICSTKNGRIALGYSGIIDHIFGEGKVYNRNYNDKLSFEGFIAGLFIYRHESFNLSELLHRTNFETKIIKKVVGTWKATRDIRQQILAGDIHARACWFKHFEFSSDVKILAGVKKDFGTPPEQLVFASDLIEINYEPSERLGKELKWLREIQFLDPLTTKKELLKRLKY